MPLAGSDFQFLKAATMGTSLTAPSNVGGAVSANTISGSSLSEVLFTMSSTASAQSQYEKTFLKNNHATITATGCVCWLPNALDDVASNGVLTFQSDSASDSSSYYCRGLGYDASGTAQQENVTLNGTTAVNGVLTFSALHRAEKRAVSGDALTAAVGNITCKVNSVTLGTIPAPDSDNSWYTATGEIAIWLESSLGGTTTTTNAGTAPAGSSFTKPRTQATGLTFANGGSVAAGSSQAIWWRWTLAANAKPSADVDAGIKFYVVTT